MADPGGTGISGRPRVVLLDVMPESSRNEITRQFGPRFEVAFAESADRAHLLELVRNADALLAMWGAVDGELIAAAEGVRVIQKLGVGVDKIDAEAAARRGITVLKAAGINADAVAEAAVMLILAVSRNLMRAITDSRAGRFEKEALRAQAFQLVGMTVGLFGLGHIGRGVARRLAGFGVSVIYYDVVAAPEDVEESLHLKRVSFEDLLAHSDMISLHAPLTEHTRELFDKSVLGRMKRGSFLVNTARGQLIKDVDLADAIRSGHLLGAGLDVTEPEPLPPESPLFDLERVIVTPHIAGAVGNNFPNVVKRALDNVTAVLSGDPVGSTADVVVEPVATSTPSY